MTKKLIVKNKLGVQTHGADSSQFESIEAFEAWKQQCIDSNVWGLPERWVADTPMTPLREEDKASALDFRDVEVMGVEVTEYLLPSEYEVVIEDISAQVEQERINLEALAFLNATDFKVLRHRDQVDAGLPTSLSAEEYAQLLVERQMARDRVVHGTN